METPFTPNIMSILRKVEEDAYHLTGDVSSAVEVRIGDGVLQYLVHFALEWKCSCGDWQDILIPCAHAWRACTKTQKRHADYVSPIYSTAKFKETYSSSVSTILRDNLNPDTNCGVPIIRRKRGRPTEKSRLRFHNEDPVRFSRKCSICKDKGHDKRNCPIWLATVATRTGQDNAERRNVDGSNTGQEGDAMLQQNAMSLLGGQQNPRHQSSDHESSDHEDTELESTQEVIDVGDSQPSTQGRPSSYGSYSQLLAEVTGSKK
ncbi:unnamed protein product [Calypogeia fissa]